MTGSNDTISLQRDISKLKIKAENDPQLRNTLNERLKRAYEQSLVKGQSNE